MLQGTRSRIEAGVGSAAVARFLRVLQQNEFLGIQQLCSPLMAHEGAALLFGMCRLAFA